MASLAKKAFGVMAAGAAALMPSPAVADDAAVPANQNAAEAQFQSASFAEHDDRDRTRRFVESGAAQASHDKLAIIVWGGRDELAEQAFFAARDLNRMGISVALIWGPQRLPSDQATFIQVYVGGAPSADMVHGIDELATLRGDLTNLAVRGYSRVFPDQLARLDNPTLR